MVWCDFGIVLGSLWDHVGMVLGSQIIKPSRVNVADVASTSDEHFLLTPMSVASTKHLIETCFMRGGNMTRFNSLGVGRCGGE